MISTLKEDESWNDNSFYIVYKQAEPVCKNECMLLCKICNICTHMYYCTCHHNMISDNTCKHIHACAKRNISLHSVRDAMSCTFVNAASDAIKSTQQVSLDKDIQDKLQSLMGYTKTSPMNDIDKNQLITKLDNCIAFLHSKNNASNNVKVNEPPN